MPAEGAKGCSSESGIMVLKQKTDPGKGAPYRCCHATTPTASASPSTTTAWWPMPGWSLPATLALRLGLPELVHNHLDLGRATGRANTAVATTRRRTARRDLGLHRFARYRMFPDGEDYFEPPSTRPARTAQSTI